MNERSVNVLICTFAGRFVQRYFFVQYVCGKVNLLIRKNILLQNNEYIFSKTHKKVFNARREEKCLQECQKENFGYW